MLLLASIKATGQSSAMKAKGNVSERDGAHGRRHTQLSSWLQEMALRPGRPLSKPTCASGAAEEQLMLNSGNENKPLGSVLLV